MHEQGTLPAPTIAVLFKLVSLFALSIMSREAGDFLEDGYMSGQQACSRSLSLTCKTPACLSKNLVCCKRFPSSVIRPALHIL